MNKNTKDKAQKQEVDGSSYFNGTPRESANLMNNPLGYGKTNENIGLNSIIRNVTDIFKMPGIPMLSRSNSRNNVSPLLMPTGMKTSFLQDEVLSTKRGGGVNQTTPLHDIFGKSRIMNSNLTLRKENSNNNVKDYFNFNEQFDSML